MGTYENEFAGNLDFCEYNELNKHLEMFFFLKTVEYSGRYNYGRSDVTLY